MIPQYLALLVLPSLTAAFSFNFDNTPRQCGDLSLSIVGSGKPPYSVLIVPFGPSTLPDNLEVRSIFTQNFTGDSTSTSFQLKYPEGSQFVAIVRVIESFLSF